MKLAPEDLASRGKRAWFFAELGRWGDAYSVSFIAASKNLLMGYAIVRASLARKRWDDGLKDAERVARAHPGLAPRAECPHPTHPAVRPRPL